MAARSSIIDSVHSGPDTNGPSTESKHVVFRVGPELYGIAIERVERIVPSVTLTRIPRTPPMFLGVFDLRGETLPCLDLRLRFDMSPDGECAHFVVVQTNLGRVALRVDEVDGIVMIRESDVERGLTMFERKDDPFVAGVAKNGEKLIVVLDPDEVVPKALRGKIVKHSAEALAA